MNTIELHTFGISNLKVNEQSVPVPQQGEVLVKIEAVSLNYVDLLVVKGLLKPNLELPYHTAPELLKALAPTSQHFN